MSHASERADAVAAVTSAVAAHNVWTATPPRSRADVLELIAQHLDDAGPQLIAEAAEETRLPQARLAGELTRTTSQLRAFASMVRDGSYVDAVIDTPEPIGGEPSALDVRRVGEPLGPVVVFAASNFPFAFGVPGGDTASALAAGCAVVVKAHPGHPRTSDVVLRVITGAVEEAGGPSGLVTMVHSVEDGVQVLLDDRICAAAFTGSTAGGRSLFDLANTRPRPIPFFGELGSLNPVFVTPSAANARADEIAEGYVASFTLNAGQFCTKPGYLFVPTGSRIKERAASLVAARTAEEMLNADIAKRYEATLRVLREHPAVELVAEGKSSDSLFVAATLLKVSAASLTANAADLLQECFGPTSFVAEYDSVDELTAAAAAFDGMLTATLHVEDQDPDAADLLAEARRMSGRVVFNGWPTGVAVTPAMHHGGPYPASTQPQSTSVGTAAVRRFLRPVCYQQAPTEWLPAALRNDNPLAIERCVNGIRTKAAW